VTVAIYVQLSGDELEVLNQAFALGGIRSAVGIPQGSINSNFRLESGRGRFFLRHTHVRSAEDLAFEASLLDHLHEGHFPGPTLEKTTTGAPFLELAGGRLTLFHFLPGEERTRDELTPNHLERLGVELGKLHRLTQSFVGERANPYSPPVVQGWLDGLADCPDAEVQTALPTMREALERSQVGSGMLPRGAIHADIFLDNVKWLGDRVSAVFDFEMACVEAYVLDLAITLNAWCYDGSYLPTLGRALLKGYQDERPLAESEKLGLFDAALFGAVRYTASRIRDFHLSPLPPDKLFKKDFRTYLGRTKALGALGASGLRTLLGL
jgi:homoserine kinase type II